MILNGEKSEWSIEHAWKAKRASDIKRLRSASTPAQSATSPSKAITRCASVTLDVLRGSEPDVSQPHHVGFDAHKLPGALGRRVHDVEFLASFDDDWFRLCRGDDPRAPVDGRFSHQNWPLVTD